MKVITDEKCTGYAQPGHPERPARITKTLEKLRAQTELPITWAKPAAFDEAILRRAHTGEHLARLEKPEDFDADHGNGTEAILLDKTGASFFSIHQHPCYPGTGTRNVGDNCFNYPVAP